MTTHLLRFDPDMKLAAAWMAAEGVAPGRNCDDGYGWHAMLRAAFGESAPSPFRLVVRRGRPIQLLAYSSPNAAELQAHAQAYADPRVYAALGIDALASKPMPRFEIDRPLGFSLLMRPVVRTDREGDRKKSRELDAYVHARSQGDARDRAVIYMDWVRKQLLTRGAEVLHVRIDGMESVNVARRSATALGNRPFRSISGHSVAFVGNLYVRDEEHFIEAISKGIGRHRAFGYGMLLLSPPET